MLENKADEFVTHISFLSACYPMKNNFHSMASLINVQKMFQKNF